jgi:hypothetical protein
MKDEQDRNFSGSSFILPIIILPLNLVPRRQALRAPLAGWW